MAKIKRKKKDKLKAPKTPISCLPKEKRLELQVVMMKFIKDTHTPLCKINSNLSQLGMEGSLETLEYLHNTGYLVFKKDEKVKRYGYRIWLYDDTLQKYCDVSRMREAFKKLEEKEKENWT